MIIPTLKTLMCGGMLVIDLAATMAVLPAKNLHWQPRLVDYKSVKHHGRSLFGAKIYILLKVS